MKKLLFLSAAYAALAMTASADYYIAGAMNGWNAAGNLMTDMGGGIYQATLTGMTASSRYEFKVTGGDWSWSAPGSGNSWLYSDGSGNVTITYDSNTYADGWSGSSGRLGVNNDPGTWTAVGDWQGWDNANASTVMTAQGGGIYMLQFLIATPGGHAFKAVDTGSWDAIGADARSINADNLGFTTSAPNQLVDFYVNALNGTIMVTVVPEPSVLALLGSAMAAGFIWLRRR